MICIYACNFPEVLHICCVHGRVAFKCCIHAKYPKIPCIQNWKLLLRSLSVQIRKMMYVIKYCMSKIHVTNVQDTCS